MSARRLAWLALAPTLLLFVGFFVIVALGPSSLADDPLNLAIFIVFVLAFAGVGALIVSKHPRNAVGWLMVASGLSFALAAFAGEWGEYGGLTSPSALPAYAAIGWITTWAWGLGAGLATTFLILLFPDGRLPSRRFAPVACIAGGSLALLLVRFAFAPGPLDLDYPGGPLNPFGIASAAAVLDTLGTVALVGLLGSSIACLASLGVRWRQAGPATRAQLRWLMYAAAVVASGLIVSTAIEVRFGGNEAAIDISNAIISGSLSVIPVAIGFAILRHRLYDIDVVINRTLVYGALSATLGLAYAGGAVLLGQLFSPFTRGSDLAIAGSTLAVAALFRPLRARIQGAVDRRFYRHRYDAARTLEGFSARLREQVDLDALGGELQAVVRETMAPAHVSLWLRGTGAR